MSRFFKAVFLTGFLLSSVAPAFAQDLPENSPDESISLPADADEWQFHFAPLYLWFAGIGGKASIGPVAVPVDVTFSDTLENLDVAFTFHFEVGKQKWKFFVDYLLLNTSAQQGVQIGATPIGGKVNTDVSNNIIEFGGAYKIWDAPVLWNAPSSMELLAGVRYTNLDIFVSTQAFNLPRPLPNVNIEKNLWDGFGGVRLIQALGENTGWRLIGNADVGAGSSDLTWSAMVTVNWQYKKWGSVRAGYKWLGYDVDTGTAREHLAYNVVYQGPIVGLVFNW